MTRGRRFLSLSTSYWRKTSRWLAPLGIPTGVLGERMVGKRCASRYPCRSAVATLQRAPASESERTKLDGARRHRPPRRGTNETPRVDAPAGRCDDGGTHPQRAAE